MTEGSASVAEVRFTPGPWTANGNGWEVRAADGQMKVCDIRGWGYLTGKGACALPDDEAVAIQKANERLIAAAPDLHEALVKALPFVGSAAARSQIICGVDAGELYFVIEAALSKAGRQL